MADHLPAMHARTGADIKDVVGLADRLFVVFHHDHRIALIPQVLERRQQAVVIALVQADGWLVEHIENAGEARADLAGQADALTFATRERST